METSTQMLARLLADTMHKDDSKIKSLRHRGKTKRPVSRNRKEIQESQEANK